MSSLSVCMMAQNSEKTLAIALESLDRVYDELLIVDGGSTDKTCEIALEYGARIIDSPWTGNHSQQRNVYLREAKTEWVFVLDSDEFIDRQVVEFLRSIKIENPFSRYNFFEFNRRWISPSCCDRYITSSPHHPDYQPRLFKYREEFYYTGKIHEFINGYERQELGSIRNSYIYHLDLFVNSETQREKKVKRYSNSEKNSGGSEYYLPIPDTLKVKEWNIQSISHSTAQLLNQLTAMSNSQLDTIIAPEIKNDEFYNLIQRIAKTEKIRTVLEIGSSSGGGSTEAFVKGLQDNPNRPTLFCMEISKSRFANLQQTYSEYEFVKCYNLSSVTPQQFPEESEVIEFYNSHQTKLNRYPIEEVLSWLKQDIEYVQTSEIVESGIKVIKKENNINFFDVVLIDGSEFTGTAELEEVYGSQFILLDDICTFKNYKSYRNLQEDKTYEIIAENDYLRNGFAIFRKRTKKQISLDEVIINLESFHEHNEHLLIQKLVRKGYTTIDVGANIGDYSLLLSHLVGYLGKVYSFEPTSSTFEKLKQRIEKYEIENIKAYQSAVFSKNEYVEINEFPEECSAWNSLGKPIMSDPYGYSSKPVPIVKTEIVEAITLDNFCQEQKVNFIDFLKVDVEGAESEVFRGARQLLEKKAVRFIQFEISRNMLEGFNKTAKETFDILIRSGYECHRIDPGGEIGDRANDSNSFYENYIAFPSLPIHFFTIVLNGEPFIHYHIDLFKQLSFDWHWHIIEGVAELKHDTAWSLQNGGEITDDFHNRGRSIDGTSEYLNKLVNQYPNNITLYRKPEGVFWNGKREMVNAPLANIQEECLLWQVDVDELWSIEQIELVRKLFIKEPEKTAAIYSCFYFLGKNLVVSTPNYLTNNWLRTWRFKPKLGYTWASHEPPILIRPFPEEGYSVTIAGINPFSVEETQQQGLVFQHLAYVLPEQLQFKEQYYGYKNALALWENLQQEKRFPVLLRQYCSWIGDDTLVDTVESQGVFPIARQDETSGEWKFTQPQSFPSLANIPLKIPKIIIDGVFFQRYQTGIARVWKSLLEVWVENGFAKYLIVLDRYGTAPKIPGIAYRTILLHDYENLESDRAMLQAVCDEENADLFISTYYSFPNSTPSVFVAYDMIPEVLGADFQEPMWQEKHEAIQHACAYIAISQNTARDLQQFFPNVDAVTVARCGIEPIFSPATSEEVQLFKAKYGITKPYFLLVAPGTGYKNAPLFFQGFSQFPTRLGFELVCTGNRGSLEEELRSYTTGNVVHTLQLSDEELRLAYAGAVALIYPSKYEGFGLPVLEALACGCPAITTPNASLPEVAGDAAFYVQDNDIEGMVNALCEIQKPAVRQSLILKGLEQVKQFSWTEMANTVSSVLIKATLLSLKLREVNFIIFPDWTQGEDELGLALQRVIQAIATHPERDRITLLVDTQGISEEDADLLLSGVVMNLLMEEDLELGESAEISLLGSLAPIQWDVLKSQLQARIILEHENEQAIAQAGIDSLPTFSIDS